MNEPAVTLTNFLLALECFAFAALLRSRPGREDPPRRDGIAFFAALGAAALAGGVVHGFLPDQAGLAHRAIWRATLLALGAAAVAGWRIGAGLVLSPRGAGLVSSLAWLGALVYALVVLFVDQGFRVAVLFYAPGVVFLATCFAVAGRRRRDPRLARAAAGLGLALFASLLQRMRIGLHPVHFDHNALYHVLEMLALVPVFLAARGLQGSAPRGAGGAASASAAARAARRSRAK